MYKTEKFIRKHIYDYSCYHHRQHVLRTLYEHNYFENEETHYKEITDLANVILKKSAPQINTKSELVECLLPRLKTSDINELKLRAFLYCINYAASDIKFSEELKYMYGESAAFESHRRAMLMFIVELIRHANSTNDLTIDCWQPSTKLIKVDDADGEGKDTDENAFLMGLKQLEGSHGENHQKWCAAFLGFNFDDENDHDEAA